MPILPYHIDVLKHVVRKITVGHRYQIDMDACIILNARLAGIDGTVTATVYTDKDPNYVSDNPIETAASEEGLIALSVIAGTSDSQNPLAPPTHADFGIFVKSEGTTDKVALLELTYVHRVDYERSFEPIKVETYPGEHAALDVINLLPPGEPWEEGTDDYGGPPGTEVDGGRNADGMMSGIGEDPDDPFPPPPDPTITGGSIYIDDHETIIIEGTTDTFGVSLNEDVAPIADVVLSVTSAATGDLTVSPSTLTFTTGNFAAKQTVTVTAVNDSDTESAEFVAVTMAVATGDSSAYTVGSVPDAVYVVKVIDTDSDIAGISITAQSFTMLEGATAGSHSVTLTAQPSADTVVQLGNSTGDGDWEVGVSASYAVTKSLTFTNSNWATAQVFTIRATSDSTVESENPAASRFTYRILSSADADYAALIGHTFSKDVLVYDDDASNFSTGIYTLAAENLDDEGIPQHLTTESGDAFIRTE